MNKQLKLDFNFLKYDILNWSEPGLSLLRFRDYRELHSALFRCLCYVSQQKATAVSVPYPHLMVATHPPFISLKLLFIGPEIYRINRIKQKHNTVLISYEAIKSNQT